MEFAQHQEYQCDQAEQAVEQLEYDCHGDSVVTVGGGARCGRVAEEEAALYFVLKRQTQKHQTKQKRHGLGTDDWSCTLFIFIYCISVS